MERPPDARSRIEHDAADGFQEAFQFHGDDQLVLDDQDPEAVQARAWVRQSFPPGRERQKA
jgi:hypothetical protein